MSLLANKALALGRFVINPAKVLAPRRISAARTHIGSTYIRGRGVEVGAGSRPFPIPPNASCYYGDIRNSAELKSYFGSDNVSVNGAIDAQTMAGIPPGSLDFIISAHVIEHLFDPLGSIVASLNCLRTGGAFVLIVPEMSKTFDRARPPTALEHVIRDAADGGNGTRLQAFIEHARHVHPFVTGEKIQEPEIEPGARATMEAGMDIHVHAWREADFYELLSYAKTLVAFDIELRKSVGNENQYVLKRL